MSLAQRRRLLFLIALRLVWLEHEVLSNDLFLPSRKAFGDAMVFFLFRFSFCLFYDEASGRSDPVQILIIEDHNRL